MLIGDILYIEIIHVSRTKTCVLDIQYTDHVPEILPVSRASSSSHISYKSAPFPLTRSPKDTVLVNTAAVGEKISTQFLGFKTKISLVNWCSPKHVNEIHLQNSVVDNTAL